MNIETLTKNLSPIYETILPFSGKKVLFTPFKVKDSKNISIILKEENKKACLNAMISVLKSNTENVIIDDLCLADAEYLYLQMRGKSVGEEITIKLQNGPYTFNIADIKTRNNFVDEQIIIKDGVYAKIKTPSIKDLLNGSMNEEIDVIKKYIKSVVVNNEIYDLNKFLSDEVKNLIENLPYSFIKKMEDIIKKQPELYISVPDESGEREVSGTLSFFTFLQTF